MFASFFQSDNQEGWLKYHFAVAFQKEQSFLDTCKKNEADDPQHLSSRIKLLEDSKETIRDVAKKVDVLIKEKNLFSQLVMYFCYFLYYLNLKQYSTLAAKEQLKLFVQEMYVGIAHLEKAQRGYEDWMKSWNDSNKQLEELPREIKKLEACREQFITLQSSLSYLWGFSTKALQEKVDQVISAIDRTITTTKQEVADWKQSWSDCFGKDRQIQAKLTNAGSLSELIRLRNLEQNDLTLVTINAKIDQCVSCQSELKELAAKVSALVAKQATLPDVKAFTVKEMLARIQETLEELSKAIKLLEEEVSNWKASYKECRDLLTQVKKVSSQEFSDGQSNPLVYQKRFELLQEQQRGMAALKLKVDSVGKRYLRLSPLFQALLKEFSIKELMNEHDTVKADLDQKCKSFKFVVDWIASYNGICASLETWFAELYKSNHFYDLDFERKELMKCLDLLESKSSPQAIKLLLELDTYNRRIEEQKSLCLRQFEKFHQELNFCILRKGTLLELNRYSTSRLDFQLDQIRQEFDRIAVYSEEDFKKWNKKWEEQAALESPQIQQKLEVWKKSWSECANLEEDIRKKIEKEKNIATERNVLALKILAFRSEEAKGSDVRLKGELTRVDERIAQLFAYEEQLSQLDVRVKNLIQQREQLPQSDLRDFQIDLVGRIAEDLIDIQKIVRPIDVNVEAWNKWNEEFKKVQREIAVNFFDLNDMYNNPDSLAEAIDSLERKKQSVETRNELEAITKEIQEINLKLEQLVKKFKNLHECAENLMKLLKQLDQLEGEHKGILANTRAQIKKELEKINHFLNSFASLYLFSPAKIMRFKQENDPYRKAPVARIQMMLRDFTNFSLEKVGIEQSAYLRNHEGTYSFPALSNLKLWLAELNARNSKQGSPISKVTKYKVEHMLDLAVKSELITKKADRLLVKKGVSLMAKTLQDQLKALQGQECGVLIQLCLWKGRGSGHAFVIEIKQDRFMIYNTGLGIEGRHVRETVRGKRYVYPFTIKNLALEEVIDLEFLEELVASQFDYYEDLSAGIQKFYDRMTFHLTKRRGEKALRDGKPYLEQTKGTCVYSSLLMGLTQYEIPEILQGLRVAATDCIFTDTSHIRSILTPEELVLQAPYLAKIDQAANDLLDLEV